MNNRAKKTLLAVFTEPTLKSLAWADIEALFLALGATVAEGSGSRVKFDLNGKTIAFHRPHKPKTARAYQVELAREFLMKIGIRP
ncbi:MAG: type II toxin-antitoxin system HicA family toxin [Desulfovibrionaceae bacterium]|nr:type II toxin-antitoxin system HicA family toxin [Desulfovibrionaceae bacterium]